MAFNISTAAQKVRSGQPLTESERDSLRRIARGAGMSAPESSGVGTPQGTSAPESGEYQGSSPMSQAGAGLIGDLVQTGTMLSGATSSIPGGAGVVGGLVEDIALGRSPGEALTRAGKNVGVSLLGRELVEAGVPGYGVGYGLGTAFSLADEYMSDDPRYGYALTKNLPGLIGTVVGAPLGPLGSLLGSTVGNYFGEQSFEEGYLGDAFDVRSFEEMRDLAEEMGYTVDDTSYMAGVDEMVSGLGGDPGDFSTSVPGDNMDFSGGFGLQPNVEGAAWNPRDIGRDFWGDSSGDFEGIGEQTESVGAGAVSGGGVSGTGSIGDETAAGFDEDESYGDVGFA